MSNYFFIPPFLGRLLTRTILLAGHTIARRTDFITVTTKISQVFGLNLGTMIPNRSHGYFGSTALAKIPMARPNSPDMPPKRTKKGTINIILY